MTENETQCKNKPMIDVSDYYGESRIEEYTRKILVVVLGGVLCVITVLSVIIEVLK